MGEKRRERVGNREKKSKSKVGSESGRNRGDTGRKRGGV
jgi:hypothetical protein